MHILGKLILLSTAASAASYWVPRYQKLGKGPLELDQQIVDVLGAPLRIPGAILAERTGISGSALTVGIGVGSALLVDSLLRK